MSQSSQDVIQLRQTLQQAREKQQARRVELYRYRGQRLPQSSPEEVIQPGQSDELARLQEALDRVNQTTRIYEVELQRLATPAARVPGANRPSTPARERGCLLSGWLFLGAIADMRYLFLLPLIGLSFFGVILGAIVVIVNLVGITMLWNLQRSGYFTLIGLDLALVVLQFILVAITQNAALGVVNIIADFINLAVLSLLVLPRWKYLE